MNIDYPPTREQIKELRKSSGLNVINTAKLIYCAPRTWWEYEKGSKRIPRARWEFFKLKVSAMNTNEKAVDN